MLLTPALSLEYEEVLKRGSQRVASGLDESDIDTFLRATAALAEPVSIHFQWRPQLQDEDDEMVLEAAVNGRADAIVTFNLRDFSAGAKVFGVALMTPAEILRRLER